MAKSNETDPKPDADPKADERAATDSCATCLHYLASSDGVSGACRRFPPEGTDTFASPGTPPLPNQPPAMMYIRYPVVYAVEWCGEFVAGTGPVAPPFGVPVADAAALQAILAADPSTVGNQTYRLAPGAYGTLTINNKDYSQYPIAFLGTPAVAATAERAATPGTWFDGVVLTSAVGVTLGEFNVDNAGSANGTGVNVNYGGYLTFNKVTVNVSALTGNGWYFDTTSNITINGQGISDNTDTDNVGNVMTFYDSNHINISNFTYTNWGPDGILFAGSTDVVIDGALAYNCTFIDQEHPDAIQGFISSRTQNPCARVRIQNSAFMREAGMESQGFFFEWTNEITYRDCYTFGGMINSFSISGGTTHLINNTFGYGFPDYGSRIGVGDGAVNATVSNNATGAIYSVGVGAGYVEINNTLGCGGQPDDYSTLDSYLALNPAVRRRPTPSGRTLGPHTPTADETPEQREKRLTARLAEIRATALGNEIDRPGKP
jgi:hypothetical protein